MLLSAYKKTGNLVDYGTTETFAFIHTGRSGDYPHRDIAESGFRRIFPEIAWICLCGTSRWLGFRLASQHVQLAVGSTFFLAES